MNKTPFDKYKLECRFCHFNRPFGNLEKARKLRKVHLQTCGADMGLEIGTNVVIIRKEDGKFMPITKGH